MADPGGYRAPASPAPVSGPGALSQRTDVQTPMSLPNPAYGEGQQFMDMQRGAPMMESPAGPPPPTALLDPTQRPDEPLTAGSAMGDGPGREALGSANPAVDEVRALGKYMPVMERMAGRMDAPRSFRALVQFIKSHGEQP